MERLREPKKERTKKNTGLKTWLWVIFCLVEGEVVPSLFFFSGGENASFVLVCFGVLCRDCASGDGRRSKKGLVGILLAFLLASYWVWGTTLC